MNLVREDRHSVYVKAGGYIFRPVINEQFRFEAVHQKTKCVKGEKVKARHIGGSTLAAVSGEWWFSHGSYYDKNAKQINSEECWEGIK